MTSPKIPAGAEWRGDQLKLRILEHAHEIRLASSKLLRLEEIAKDICTRTITGFDFVSVQMVDLLERSIESIFGSRSKGEWYNLSSHSIDGDTRFLDIQAYVATQFPPVIEVIAGWDDRFDRFIYEKYHHENFVRAFVPLIVLRDAEGRLTKVDPTQFGFEPFGFEASRNGLTGSIRIPPSGIGDRAAGTLHIIGTIEAGFDNAERTPKQEISVDDARELFHICCDCADKLRQATLEHVLEIITRSAMEIAGGNVTSLHYPHQFTGKQRGHAYEIWAGMQNSETFRPRKRGLGEQAIVAAEPKFLRASKVSPSQADIFNPAVYAAGIKSIGAFPLIIDIEDQSPFSQHPQDKNAGILYVGLKDDCDFPSDVIEGLAHFTKLAEDAIRHATRYTETVRSARQLANLYEMSLALAHEIDAPDLLESIAGHTLNVLSADLVIIYEYDEAGRHFLTRPAVGGRYEKKFGDFGANENYTPPIRLIQTEQMLYAHSPEEVKSLLETNEHAEISCRFIEEQRIVSAASVALWLRDEVVGVMIIAYRCHRELARYKKAMETLASTAGIAIRNRRFLKSRQDCVDAMTHQIRTPLFTATVLASGLRRRLRHQSFADERDFLTRHADQLAFHLEVLDGLCEGVFVSLTQEVSGSGNRKSVEPGLEDIDVRDEVNRLWEFLQLARGQSVSEGDLHLQLLDGCTGDPMVRIDRRVFTNVVYTLLDNAMKYADRPSQLQVDLTSLPSGESLLKVCSIGHPIGLGDRETVFQKFRKSSAVGQPGMRRDSMGIGLWIARTLIRSIGGEIWLELDPKNPRASTFMVRIPN
jgi:signal transduction histidine kinase